MLGSIFKSAILTFVVFFRCLSFGPDNGCGRGMMVFMMLIQITI